MTDLMDERLSAAARRWQAEQPPPPGVPLDRLGPPRPGRLRGRAGLAAAVAAVLAVGVGVAVTRESGGSSSGPSDTSSSRSPGVHQALPVVPWRDLAPRHPRIAHREHGRLVTPFDNVMADGHIGGHVHPGDILRFTVYLESDTDVSLAPCPDYIVYFGTARARSWHLNCAQVPYRQADAQPKPGVVRLHVLRRHPVLPAGRRVEFAMRVTVPDVRGRQKVLWTLVGPTTMPGFYGIVHVTPR